MSSAYTIFDFWGNQAPNTHKDFFLKFLSTALAVLWLIVKFQDWLIFQSHNPALKPTTS